MNDSFLEDLDLLPREKKEKNERKEKKTDRQSLDCYITTRPTTSSPLLSFTEQEYARDNIMRTQKVHCVTTIPNIPNINIASNKNPSSKDSKKQSDIYPNIKKHCRKIKLEKGEKIESKGKLTDIKIKVENNKHQDVNKEVKIKLQETKHIVPENKSISKDYYRRSGSYKDTIPSVSTTKENRHSTTKENRHSSEFHSNHSSDTSSKENNHPSDSSKETGSYDSAKGKEKLPANLKKSSVNIQDQNLIALLNAIKDLISMYTKQESTKILRTMQELHINSQATLIKNFLEQTDDLIKEMHPSKESARVKMLHEENERLQHELITLKTQNDDLQSKLEELEFLKQENAILKLKCR